MKFSRILSASVLAGAVLFAGSACAAPNSTQSKVQPETNSSAEAKPAKNQDAQTAPAVDEKQAVAEVVNGYYTYVSIPSNFAEIEQAGAPLMGRGAEASDDELKQLVDSIPQGFQYFDTSTSDNIKNAYAQLIMGATVMKKGNIEVHVPASAVTVAGDTATLQTTGIDFTVNGEKSPVSSTSGTQILKLKKDESGSWVMIPEDLLSQMKQAKESTTK